MSLLLQETEDSRAAPRMHSRRMCLVVMARQVAGIQSTTVACCPTAAGGLVRRSSEEEGLSLTRWNMRKRQGQLCTSWRRKRRWAVVRLDMHVKDATSLACLRIVTRKEKKKKIGRNCYRWRSKCYVIQTHSTLTWKRFVEMDIRDSHNLTF